MKVKDLSVLLFAFLLLGCATTKGAFNQAKAQDTIPAYEQFLAKYPKSEFTNEANNRLGALRKIEAEGAFNQAKAQDTIPAYEQFLAKYPKSEFSNDAKNRLGALRKIEADVAAKTKSILSSYKIGQTTYAEFERDTAAGRWKKRDYKVSEIRSIEEGKSALEGKLLGSKATVTLVYSPNKYCHLEFEGKAEPESAVLVSIKFY